MSEKKRIKKGENFEAYDTLTALEDEIWERMIVGERN